MDADVSSICEENYKVSDLLESKVKQTNYTSHTLLHWAVQHGDLQMFRNLILNKCDLNHMDSTGTTPLMLASLYGNSEMIKLLLQSGADPLICNHYGADALAMACAGNHSEIVDQLSGYFTNQESESIWPQHPIIIAAVYASKSCIEILINKDPECINKQNEISGMNAVMIAEARNSNDVVEFLMSNSAKRNPEVKKFTIKPSNLHLTPKQNLSYLVPSSPYYSSCCNTPIQNDRSQVFLFPSPKSHSGSIFNFPNPSSPICLPVPSFNSNNPHEHPLTPNLCFSPVKKQNLSMRREKKPMFTWLKKLKRKRSKSLENVTRVKHKKCNEIDRDNILDYILLTASLSEYRHCFETHEITFRTFLTLNEDELIEVGIKKPKVRKKFLKLINHYKRIFNTQL